jgi:anhydro-N-acetylmuramic acid kinase
VSEFSRLVELMGSLPAEEWATLARTAPEPTASTSPELGPKELFELARERLDRRPGNLPEVTGARGPRVLGAVYPAP